MIMDKTSIILDDKNAHYALISKVIRIVKDKYNNKFRVSDITSLEEFTITEKQYLKKNFLPTLLDYTLGNIISISLETCGITMNQINTITERQSDTFCCYSTRAKFQWENQLRQIIIDS